MSEAANVPTIFAEPTPMGLIGLAIGCAALTPIALGLTLTPAALKTAAMLCLLFLFLLVIDLMYLLKIVAGLTGTAALGLPIAVLTIALGLLALWIAFALLLNPVTGRRLFWFPGPVFKPSLPTVQ